MYDFVSIFLEEITKNVFKLQSSLPAFGANMIVKFQTIGFSLEAKSLHHLVSYSTVFVRVDCV